MSSPHEGVEPVEWRFIVSRMRCDSSRQVRLPESVSSTRKNGQRGAEFVRNMATKSCRTTSNCLMR